jgi:hypothetical protein
MKDNPQVVDALASFTLGVFQLNTEKFMLT